MKCLDDTVTFDFVEGKLAPRVEAEIKEHLDTCEDCRTLVSGIAKSMRGVVGRAPAVWGSPTTGAEVTGSAVAPMSGGRAIGRYEVEGVIGAGGMGVVYLAYDPELDRKVALKLLRANLDAPEAMDRLQRRLSREARAMARLSHENVVAVHDTGTVDGRVFVAMELVDGVSLGAWLKSRPRRWEDVLAVYLRAGQGLAAAHKAGLVHRDFKPDNVLVGNDGRVRVTDFGLARPIVLAPAARSSGHMVATASGGLPSARVRTNASGAGQGIEETRADVVAGTPAYMAPEQLMGKPADERSDQFSFCAALFEGVYGQGPFAARSIDELAAQTTSGLVREPPRDSRVPGWLRRVLLRGLRPRPRERFPSMAELLVALERRRWGLRRRIIVLIAIATTLLAGAFGYREAIRERGAVCDGATTKLDGIWDAKRRREVEVAFSGAGAAYAHDSWLSCARLLDDYARRWATVRTDACLATRVRGEQSEELLDLRMACLDERLQRVAALARLLSAADAKIVEKSVEAVQSLPSLEPCSDAAALRSGVRPPADVVTAARVAAIREALAEVSALEHAGKYKEARDAAALALKQARALQYLPVEAEALYQQGVAEGDLGDHGAEATLDEAATVAEAGSHHEIAARAWIDLAYFVGYEQTRFEQGHRWLRYAATALERMGGNDELEAERLERLGLLGWAEGKNTEALGNLERARALFEKRLGSAHIAVGKTLDAIALVRYDLGRFEEAADLQARAVTIDLGAYGPLHPVLALLLNNRANSLMKLGRNPEALAAVERSIDIFERTVGPDHPSTYFALDTKGNVLMLLGRLDEADGALRRARTVLEKAGKTAHPDYAEVLDDIGELDRQRGAYEEALANHRKALGIQEAALGATHADVAMSHYDIGEVRLAQGKFAEAVDEDTMALAILAPGGGQTPEAPDGGDTAEGEEVSKAASVLTGLGEGTLGMGDATRARVPLERALAMRKKLVGEAPELARTRFALAGALWGGGDAEARDRALALARQARETYAGDPSRKAALNRVDAWLSNRKPP